MKLIKKMIAASLALGLMLSMYSGCGMFTNYKAIAEQALEDKYGEEFICHSTWDEGDGYCFAELSPAYDDTMRFYAGINTNDKYSYHDAYPEEIVGKQISDIVYAEIANIWSECYISVSINDQGLDFTNKNDISIDSYYQMADLEIAHEPHIDIVINTNVTNPSDYSKEYETFLSIAKKIGVEKSYFRLYFVDDTAFQEYKTWFSSTYNIHNGDFKNRKDFQQRITLNVNCITEEFSISKDKYISQRKES